MRYPQVLVHDEEGGLARALAPLAEARKPPWTLRRPRRLDACARLVRRGHPCVLVLKAGRDLTREMGVVDRVRAANPEAQVIVVAAAASPALTALAWHLGAAYVFTAEPAPETLASVVEALMQRSYEQCLGSPPTAERGKPADAAPQETDSDDE